MNILILIFIILYFILAFRRLDLAVMLLIAAMPSYLIRFSFLGIPFTILEAMILISFGVWLLKNYKQIAGNIKIKFQNRKSQIANQQSKRYPFDIELVLLLIVSFLAVFVTGLTDSAFGIWKAYFFEPALFFILVINVFGKREKLSFGYPKLSFLLWPLLISALVVSLLAIYQKFTGAFIFNEFWAAPETRRVTSFFGFPNAVGLYLGPIALVLIGFLFSQIKDKKSQIFNFQFSPLRQGFEGQAIFKQFSIYKLQIFIGVVTLVSLLSIYFAKSEGAIIGVAAGLVVFGLLSGKKIRWATVGIVILVTAGIMIFAPTREYAVNKILLRDLSGQIRKAQWKETWEMLQDNRIIFGSGLANYRQEILPYHKEGIFVRDYNDPDWHRKTVFNEEYRKKVWQPLEIYLYPHNIFLNFWAELGIAGMLLFVWIIGKYFMVGARLIRKSKIENRKLAGSKNNFFVIGILGAMVVIVVHGLVDVPYFKNDLAVMFWVLIAMMSLINLKLKNES